MQDPAPCSASFPPHCRIRPLSIQGPFVFIYITQATGFGLSYLDEDEGPNSRILSNVEQDVFCFDIPVDNAYLVQSADPEGFQSRRRETSKTRKTST